MLGLGDIGPLAAKPVMEGKGCLFKKFAGIDVFDIELAERDPDDLIDIIAALEPTLGGINLEDIKAPECFYIERKLTERMNIPVFHDDQHGTAIISAAAIRNGLELVGKDIGKVKLVVSGAGAAAIAVLDLLVGLGLNARERLGLRLQGPHLRRPRRLLQSGEGALRAEDEAAHAGRCDAGRRRVPGLLHRRRADAGHGASGMAHAPHHPGAGESGAGDPPGAGARPRARTASSPRAARTTPNQVNNVLCFPYIFRGALDCGATKITAQMKLACVKEIADLAKAEISEEVASAYAGQELAFGDEYIIPKPFDSRLILRIAPAVAAAAAASGVATRPIADMEAYRAQLTRMFSSAGMLTRPVFGAAQGLDAQARGAGRRRGSARAARGADRAGRRPGHAHPHRPPFGDRGAHRQGGPAHEAGQGRHLRESGR